MSTFDVKQNTAICALPWIQEYKTLGGSVGPCCQGETLRPGESIQDVRDAMIQGKKHRACQICYKTEKDSGWSYRIQQTTDWIAKFGTPDVAKPSVEYIDVRFDPTCNLKCKTCGPYASTLWQKEKGIKQEVQYHNKDYFKNVDKKILKKVYLAGGEPTYIKSYLEFLQELHEVNPDCEVIVNTNLKKLPDAWKEIFVKFENMTVTCSCDAIEDLATYVRYPIGWEEFEENVKFVSKNVNFLQFNLVASNLTVHRIDKTCEWMKQYSKHINLTALHRPKIFSEYSVPMSHRQRYIDALKNIEKFPVSIYFASSFRSQVKLLLKKYAESGYLKPLHNELRAEISEQDSHRSIDLHSVDRFLHEWVYE